MHKKLANDLTSLAHSILQMKNKEDVFALKEKAYQVYEKLALLAYIEEYINTTPNASESKEELIEKIEKSAEESLKITEVSNASKIIVDKKEEESPKKIEEEKTTIASFEDLEQTLFDENSFEKNDVRDVGERKTATLEEELEDAISLDVAADLFEKMVPKKSLNDALQKNIQIGLNDRIAFVKHLFEGDQSDFNRVISQLNTFKTEKEAKKFINKMVKPDYNWSDKEEYEERFLAIIERKFA